MTGISSEQATGNGPIRWWLIALAALIAIMVLVGGATRLTESGLSIVEWKPVAGTLPPLTEAEWAQVFEGYKAIPQYREFNAGMSLAEFKIIFWWEWSHRLLGRSIGVAYLVPFVWFFWRGVLSVQLRRRLWLIFGLGALQGAVGWWMVASGLSQRVEVSQYRLATHLVLALVIFAAIVWTLRRLSDRRRPLVFPSRLKITSVVLVALTFVQLYLGALVAGLRAGKVYNTWPEIDGGLVPSAARLFFEMPWWRNLFENTLTVQFEHRMIAYALFVIALAHAYDTVRSRAGVAVNGAWWLVAIITLQATLGVVTLLKQVPIDLALAHQAGAMAVLTLAVFQAERFRGRGSEQKPPSELVLPAQALGSR